MTIAQIIAKAKRKKSTGESDANLIIDLNGIQNKLWMELRQYQEAFGAYYIQDDDTVADQLEYTLDAGVNLDNVFLVKVESYADCELYEWETFKYAGEKDDVTTGNYWQRITSGKIAILKDGEAMQTAGLEINIYYTKEPTAISSTSQTPDLKANYHDLYVYGLVYEICFSSDNPDIELGTIYKQLFDEMLEKVKADLKTSEINIPYSVNQKAEGW